MVSSLREQAVVPDYSQKIDGIRERGAGDGGGDEGVEAIVRDLAGEAAVQNERAGEGEDDPEQAAGDFARRVSLGIEGEAEHQQDHEREGERRVDRFPLLR